MRTKLIGDPQTSLWRTIDLLTRELIVASDEEIMEAAKELGMNPQMKGSAAFLGLRYLAADFDYFFDPDTLKSLQLARSKSVAPAQATADRKPRRLRRPSELDREDSSDE